MKAYETARLNMVDGQIRPNKVTHPAVIAAFLELPRERFVPAALRGAAYVDEDIPVAPGRYLIEPMVLARLIQTAAIEPGDRVLELGSGTGYATAILARVAREVVSLEPESSLAEAARTMLGELGVRNARIVEHRLDGGYPTSGPYDVIVFGGAVAAVPPVIAEQLAEGGRLVAVVKRGPGTMGQAQLTLRSGGALSRRFVFDAGTPLLPGFAAQPGFVF